ncbi:MAG: hypothetical protein ABSH21_08035 [Verrucomicrobiia bacterium]|jgi:hypothetical protein
MHPDDLTPEQKAQIEKEYIETRIRLCDRLAVAGWVSQAIYIEGKRGDVIFTEMGRRKFATVIRLLMELSYDPENATREDLRAFCEIVYAMLHSMPPREGKPLPEDWP